MTKDSLPTRELPIEALMEKMKAVFIEKIDFECQQDFFLFYFTPILKFKAAKKRIVCMIFCFRKLAKFNSYFDEGNSAQVFKNLYFELSRRSLKLTLFDGSGVSKFRFIEQNRKFH